MKLKLKHILSVIFAFTLAVGLFAAPLAASADSQQDTADTISGVLICANCVWPNNVQGNQADGTPKTYHGAPVTHTLMCTLMESCKASGYGLLIPQADNSYKFYKLDADGDAKALALLQQLNEQATAKNYLTVNVVGKQSENSGVYNYTFNGQKLFCKYDGMITDITNIEYDASHGVFAQQKKTDIGALTIAKVPDQSYTGTAITFANDKIADIIKIKDGSYELMKDFDYAVAYSNNTEVGQATVNITGQGAFYTGSQTVHFNIVNSGDSNNDKPAGTTETKAGVLMCSDCATGIQGPLHGDPKKHTVNCSTMPNCQASGYGILIPAAKGSHVWEGVGYDFYKFDADGDAKALDVLNKLDTTNSYVTVNVGGVFKKENGVHKYNGGSANYEGTVTNVTSIQYDSTHNAFEKAIDNVSGSAADPSMSAAEKFKDVDTNAWYTEYISYIVNNGLMNGSNNNVFEPNATLNRAMLATIIYRMAGEPAVNGSSSFNDVKPDQWYSNAIAWAATNGIVSGYGEGLFGINDSVTREQMAAMIMRYCDYCKISTEKTADLGKFTDSNKISSWAVDAIAWANGVGLINGRTATTIEAQGTTTRAEAAAILMRLSEQVLK